MVRCSPNQKSDTLMKNRLIDLHPAEASRAHSPRPLRYQIYRQARAGNYTTELARPRLLAWAGPTPNETYNGKPVLDSGGKPAFAELLILEAFIAAGWEGAWVDTYRNRFLTGFWPVP